MRLEYPELPPLTLLRQEFPPTRVADVAKELRSQLDGNGVTLKPSGRYAIAIGSRGIANLQALVQGVVEWVRARGAEPFIVPAMGSHGGATAEGQTEVLKSYGITESKVGAPILSSMEVVELPRSGLELATYMDRHAHGATGTIILNRVKPHTDFHAPYESGLVKMMVIGLGKHHQALAVHRRQSRGLCELIPQVARNVLKHGNIVLGVGVVENAYDETLTVRAFRPDQIMDGEPELLRLAYANMPSLPVDALDTLIVDEIGKDISGVCLDSNIIGRMGVYDLPDPATPRIRIVYMRDLTKGSHGNAIGVGLGDIMSRRLFSKIDLPVTYENLITNSFLDRGKLPIVAENDRDALAIAWRSCGSPSPDRFRVLRIVNTLRLKYLLATPAVVEQLRCPAKCETLGIVDGWFGEDGELNPFPTGDGHG
jgi:hypothetical protein